MVRALSSNVRTSTSVTLLDCPGFQNPASCGRSSGGGGGGGASFDDLCHNYINERLQLMFHHAVFTSQQDLYAQVRACVRVRVGRWSSSDWLIRRVAAFTVLGVNFAYIHVHVQYMYYYI